MDVPTKVAKNHFTQGWAKKIARGVARSGPRSPFCLDSKADRYSRRLRMSPKKASRPYSCTLQKNIVKTDYLILSCHASMVPLGINIRFLTVWLQNF